MNKSLLSHLAHKTGKEQHLVLIENGVSSLSVKRKQAKRHLNDLKAYLRFEGDYYKYRMDEFPFETFVMSAGIATWKNSTASVQRALDTNGPRYGLCLQAAPPLKNYKKFFDDIHELYAEYYLKGLSPAVRELVSISNKKKFDPDIAYQKITTEHYTSGADREFLGHYAEIYLGIYLKEIARKSSFTKAHHNIKPAYKQPLMISQNQKFIVGLEEMDYVICTETRKQQEEFFELVRNDGISVVTAPYENTILTF